MGNPNERWSIRWEKFNAKNYKYKYKIEDNNQPVFCAPIGLICACVPKNENDLDN